MTSGSIEKFLQDNAEVLRKLANRRDVSLGFNAFALMSDVYQRENFHSDILRAILDPNSGHGEGTLFLRKFVEFLSGRAQVQGKRELAEKLNLLSFDGPIEVLREEGRIDIKITTPEWTIIVENKINGAGDMKRQIPRYLEKCCNKKENVVAAVYLKASKEDTPSKNGWKEDDDKKVKDVLISVCGFTETRSVSNLTTGWLEPCELVAKNFNVKSTLSQYSQLVINQAGKTMNMDEMSKLLSVMNEKKLSYSELMHTLEAIPQYVAEIICNHFKRRDDVQVKCWVWRETVAVIDFNAFDDGGKGIQFSIDIHCEALNESGVSFFARRIEPLSTYLALLQESDSRFSLETKWKEYRIAFTCDQDKTFAKLNEFIGEIEHIVDFVGNNRARFEKIAQENHDKQKK